MQISKLAGNSLSVAMARIIDRLDFEFIVDVVASGSARPAHTSRSRSRRRFISRA
jgi:hypothetical protein